MAKDKLTDYDSVASNNLDVGGISVAEGMLPSGVNNAIRELMSHQAGAFGAGTPLYVDQTNNRLGIGTSSPKTELNIAANNSGQGAKLTIENTDTAITTNDIIGQIDFYANDASTNGTGAKVNIKAIATSAAGTNTGLTFGTSDSSSTTAVERMRIDPNGNLLVGTTINSVSETGFRVLADGAGTKLSTTADNEIAGLFNRNTTDGSVISIRQDGSAVGSIGTNAGDLLIGTGITGLRFNDGADEIIPRNTSGVQSAGVTSLGNSSSRFKDLYLSGGVYLGGTGSANYLDDYEEGAWTPNFIGIGTATNNNGTAYYKKIGKVVYLTFPYISWTSGAGSGTTDIEINNLPFTNNGTTDSDVIGLQANGPTYNGLQTNFLFLSSSTRVKFYRNNTTSWVRLTGSTLQNSWSFGANVFYFTND